MSAHDQRDDDGDWPEDDVNRPSNDAANQPPEPVEPEDDAAQLPVRHRRPAQRRRTGYRPPSELDHD